MTTLELTKRLRRNLSTLLHLLQRRRTIAQLSTSTTCAKCGGCERGG